MTIPKALADETRVRILMALSEGELCVCQIIELLGLAPSTISKHLSLLNQSRLVNGRKDGRWVYYRLAGKDESQEVREAIKWIQASLISDPQIKQDSKKLVKILKTSPEELCRKQTAR